MAVASSQPPTRLVTKTVRFTGNGTWTVPAGVDYAVAHMRGGGSGVTRGIAGNVGGQSSVAFATGTVVAFGMNRMALSTATGGQRYISSPANSGASGSGKIEDGGGRAGNRRSPGAMPVITAGSVVTPGQSVAVVVGAGGTGSANGGSGYVWIEYQQEEFV